MRLQDMESLATREDLMAQIDNQNIEAQRLGLLSASLDDIETARIRVEDLKADLEKAE